MYYLAHFWATLLLCLLAKLRQAKAWEYARRRKAGRYICGHTRVLHAHPVSICNRFQQIHCCVWLPDRHLYKGYVIPSVPTLYRGAPMVADDANMLLELTVNYSPIMPRGTVEETFLTDCTFYRNLTSCKLVC